MTWTAVMLLVWGAISATMVEYFKCSIPTSCLAGIMFVCIWGGTMGYRWKLFLTIVVVGICTYVTEVVGMTGLALIVCIATCFLFDLRRELVKKWEHVRCYIAYVIHPSGGQQKPTQQKQHQGGPRVLLKAQQYQRQKQKPSKQHQKQPPSQQKQPPSQQPPSQQKQKPSHQKHRRK